MTYLGAYASLKVVGYVVILLMVASIGFAVHIALAHYTGIGV
jgi:hypothetical protein